MGKSPEVKDARGLGVLLVAITKPISVRPKTNWAVSPGVGRNPKSIQGYLHEMLVPHNHAYKHAIIRPSIYCVKPEGCV